MSESIENSEGTPHSDEDSSGGDSFANETDNEDENGENVEDPMMFSRGSISVTASSIGIPSVSDEVCQHIAEELFYKTKELIYTAKLIFTQNKKSTLTTNDVKKAMQLLGGVEIYGHNSPEEVNFQYIPKAEVFVEDDSEIDIDENILSECTYNLKRDPYVHGTWIMPEGYSADPAFKGACAYYQKIAKTILNGKPAHLKVALSDLRTNPKIGPICPYFLNLVALTVKKVPRDIHVTNALIGTVHAIAHNKFVDPSPYLAANRAVNSLLKVVVEGNITKIGDDFVDNDDDLTVRVRAGILLAKVVIMWSIELKQQIDIVRHLLHLLVNPTVPLQSHYGAIVALTTLGHKRLDYFWPVVEKFVDLLEVKIDSKKYNIMVRHVMIAILVAARNTFKTEQGSNPKQLKRLREVDKTLYTIFGDGVTPLRLVAIPPIFKRGDTKVQPGRLKLKIRWRKEKKVVPASPESNVDSTSEKNIPYYFVERNHKTCRPSYKSSASGDLLLML